MTFLDAGVVRSSLSAEVVARLDELEIFPEIESTNSYLLQQKAPDPGRFRVALADHQTAGRGRHDRSWLSPPGAGLCLSGAHTFAAMPSSLPNLTLSLGVGVLRALSALGICSVSLKWPNDVVALDGKLGGMLAEARSGTDGSVTVVAGIGINIDLREQPDFGLESDWAHKAVDLKSIVRTLPSRSELAGAVVEQLSAVFVGFEQNGFDGYIDEWRTHDWLLNKVITVDMPDRQITGTAEGIDPEGALLVATKAGQRRVISGSIVMASAAGVAS